MSVPNISFVFEGLRDVMVFMTLVSVIFLLTVSAGSAVVAGYAL